MPPEAAARSKSLPGADELLPPGATGSTWALSFRRIALAAFVVALALLPLSPVPEFWITQANYIGLYTLVVMGLVLLTGIAGLTSFGQAAFVGLGAYTAAYLTLTHGVSPWLTVWIGLVVTGVAALALGWVTLRMSGHYLPLATIAWGLSLFYLLGNLDFLGKYDGLLGIPALEFFGQTLNTGRSFFYLLWTLVILAGIGVTHLLDSRTGRDARGQGRPTLARPWASTRRVSHAFVIAALLASVSGCCSRTSTHVTRRPSADMGIGTCSWPCSGASATSGARWSARPPCRS